MKTTFAPEAELLRSLAQRIDREDPGACNNLGVLYHAKGLHQEAVDAFLAALALEPRMRTAARNLEVAAMAPGACDRRLGALAARIEADAGDLDARREEIRLLRLIGRLDEATHKCDSLIAEYPDDARSLIERGLIEQRTGDLRRAQRWLDRASNAAPGDPLVSLHLAEVLYHRGANEQALALLDELLADDGSIADAHLLRGFILGDIGKLQEAQEAAAMAARINPALASLNVDLSIDGGTELTPVGAGDGGELAHYSLALAFRQRGYLDGARRELERARVANEDPRLVDHAIAELDLVSGRSSDAVLGYSDLLARYEDAARLWCEHGVAMHQSGYVEDAAESYRRALRSDPGYAIAYNNLGVALAHIGDLPASREALARAIELDPSLTRARLNLALWHRDRDDLLSAMALLRELTSFHGHDVQAWSELGAVMRKLGQLNEAQHAYVRAVEADPEDATARYGLADLLGQLGDDEGAAREMQRAMALSPLRHDMRMQPMIELQRECPEAFGKLDLLAFAATDPLDGATIGEEQLAGLFTEVPSTASQSAPAPEPGRRAQMDFDEAEEYARRGLHGEASERYRRAYELLGELGKREGLGLRALLGDIRSRCLTGRGEEILPEIRELASRYPNDAEFLVLQLAAEAQAVPAASGAGLAHLRQLMQRLAHIEPASAAIMHYAGDVALSVRDEAFAMLFYRRALAYDATRPTPRVAIARMLIANRAFVPAALELSAALAAVPGMRDASLEMARVKGALGEHRVGTSILKEILHENPTDIEALILLGESLLASGRTTDARIAIAHALRHDPENRNAIRIEASILAGMGRDKEARERLLQVTG